MNNSIPLKTYLDYLKLFASDASSFPLPTLEEDLQFLFLISKKYLEEKYKNKKNRKSPLSDDRIKMNIITAVALKPNTQMLADIGINNVDEFLFYKYPAQHRIHYLKKFLQEKEPKEETKTSSSKDFKTIQELLQQIGPKN